MKTLFGLSIHNLLFISGGIFLLIAAIIITVGLLKARSESKTDKPIEEIERNKNVAVISASVCFSVAIVLIGTGVFVYFSNRSDYVPPPSPSPAVNDDEQMIDDKLDEGWYLQPKDSKHSNPKVDPCVINKDNVADWGLQHGEPVSEEECQDVDAWILRKNQKQGDDSKGSKTVRYRGLNVIVPKIKKSKSPGFYAKDK